MVSLNFPIQKRIIKNWCQKKFSEPEKQYQKSGVGENFSTQKNSIENLISVIIFEVGKAVSIENKLSEKIFQVGKIVYKIGYRKKISKSQTQFKMFGVGDNFPSWKRH